MTLKKTGRLAAGALIALVGCLLVLAVLRGKVLSPRSGAGAVGDLALPPPGTKTVAVSQSGLGGPVQDLVSGTTEGVWTRVDPQNGRLLYELTWKKLDPQESGLFYITSPRARIFQPGRTIEVTAKTAKVLWPSRDAEPESGQLEGEVLVAVRPKGEGPAAAEPAAPLDEDELLIRADALNFHTALGELRTAEEVVVDGMGAHAEGKGLTMRFTNDRARPLSFMRLEEGGRFTFTPRQSAGARPGAGGQGAEAPAPERRGGRSAPEINYYRATFGRAVKVTAGERTLEGEEANAFLRLVDGGLRPGSIAPLERSRPAAASDGAAGAPDSTGGPTADAPAGMELVWKGPLEVRPMAEEPSELVKDDVLFRVQAPSAGAVRLRDETTGADLRCVSLEYGATTRHVSLYGVGPLGVTLTAPEMAELIAGRAELDLTTGVGSIATPGMLRAIGKAARKDDDPAFEPGERPRQVTWQERADFLLDASSGPIGTSGTVLPSEVVLRGRVEARDGLASVRGDFLRTVFGRTPGMAGAAPEPTLSRLIVEGDALAEDGRGGKITADALDVAFAQAEEGGGEPVPTAAGARGNVRAERGGDVLRAGMLDARLKRDERGQVRIASLDARLGVEAMLARGGGGRERASSIEAKADRVAGDVDGGVIELLGEPATIARTKGEESGSVSGSSMRVSTSQGSEGLTVFGAGSAAYSLPARDEKPGARIQVEWTSGLVYDDAAGRAEVMGDAVASAELDDRDRYVGRGGRIVVDLTPGRSTGDAATGPADRRELIRASIESTEEERPAELELRRYVDEVAGQEAAPGVRVQRLEGLAFLRAAAVELDALKATMAATGPGLLLLEDRRPAKPAEAAARAPDAEGPLVVGNMQGTTLFHFEQALNFERASGEGEMNGRVRVRHLDAATQRFTDIECEQLKIQVQESAAGAEAGREGPALRLVRAEAIGAVFARHGSLQVVGDAMTYDAKGRTLTATASPGNRVTVFDEARGRHFTADAASVDLATGSWRAVEAGTITVPR